MLIFGGVTFKDSLKISFRTLKLKEVNEKSNYLNVTTPHIMLQLIT